MAWAEIGVPTLLVAARQDRLAPFEAVEACAAANSNVSLEAFEGGHFDTYQTPLSGWASEREALFSRGGLRVNVAAAARVQPPAKEGEMTRAADPDDYRIN